MKIYLVETSYEDYHPSIEKTFTTYKGASQWLINEGYEPYFDYNIHGEIELNFYWEDSVEYMADCSYGEIIEMEVLD